MHVVLLANEYPPFIIGGIGTFMRDLARGLSRKGIQVTVISGQPVSNLISRQSRLSEENDEGIRVLRFPYPKIPPYHTMFQAMNLKSIFNMVKEIDPDIIHGQSGSTFPSSILLKNIAPILVTFHTSPMMQKKINAYSVLRGGSLKDFQTFVIGYPAWSYTFKKELNASHISVAVSRTLTKDLIKEMGSRFTDKFCSIYNGVDIERLDGDLKVVNCQNCEGMPEKTILFAGRLFWGKGVLRLLEVAHFLKIELPDFKVIVHGKGPLYGKMLSKIRALNLTNVELSGFADRNQMAESLNRSSFVIIPSYYEACPMMLLEGMCLGKIPLMFNHDYSHEFTKDGSYALISNNSLDLVKDLKTMCKTKSIANVSDNIKKFARTKYDINTTVSKYIELYKDLK